MDILETRATLCTRHKEDKTIQKLKNEDELQTTEHIRTNQIHYTEKHTAKRENEKKRTKYTKQIPTKQISKKISNTDINK